MTEPVLKLSNICKSFGALKASDDISLDLRRGEIHALIGPNGAGKSTLIAQIVGALRQDSGNIEFLGVDVGKNSVAQRAATGMARTFQVSALAMDDTVLQNVLLAVIGANQMPFRFFRPALAHKPLVEQAMTALEQMGLAALASKQTTELSHGQRRQLEVAIALSMNPKSFIMDEPMAGLGAGGSRELTGFLDGLRQQAPILLVEHDMDAVFALADRISVLVYGRVIATGSVEDIRQNPDVRAAYLGQDP